MISEWQTINSRFYQYVSRMTALAIPSPVLDGECPVNFADQVINMLKRSGQMNFSNLRKLTRL